MKKLPGPKPSSPSLRTVERFLEAAPATALVCRPWDVDAFVAWSEGCWKERRVHVSRVAAHSPVARQALWQAARARLEAQGGRLFEVSCRRPGGGAAALAALVAALLEAVGEPDLAGCPEWASLAWLGETAAGPTLDPLPAPIARLRWQQAFHGLLERAAAQGPLTIALNDYEAADALVRAWVTGLRQPSAELPLHVCLAVPFDAEAAEAELRLPPIAPEHAAELVGLWLGDLAPEQEERARLVERTGGDVTALFRACLPLAAEMAAPEAPVSGGSGLPSDGPERVLAEALAVGGEALEPERLAALCALPAEAFEKALTQGLRSGAFWWRAGCLDFVVPAEAEALVSGLSQEARSRWHERWAEAAAASGRPALAAWHALRGGDALVARLAGRVGPALERARALGDGPLEGELLASVLRGNAEAGSQRALDHRLRLVELQLEHGAPEMALAWLGEWRGQAMPRVALLEARACRFAGETAAARSVLAASTPGTNRALRARWACEVAALELAAGRPKEARAQAERALAQTEEPALKAEAWGLLGEAWLGAFDEESSAEAEAQAAFLAAIEAGHACGRLDAAGRAYRGLALVQQRAGWGAEAWGSWTQYRAMCLYLEDGPGAEQAGLALAALALDTGYFELALVECAALEAALDETTAPAAAARVRGLRSLAALYLGHAVDPLPLLEQGLRVARELGDQALTLEVFLWRGHALLFLGRYAEAQADAQQALELAQARGAREEARRVRLLLAELAWRAGDAARAEGLYLDVREDAEAAVARLSWAGALAGQARLALRANRLEEGLGLIAEALAVARAGGWGWAQAEFCLVQGELAWRLERKAEALGAYDEALFAADAINSPHHRALALFGLSGLAEGAEQAESLRGRAYEHLRAYLEPMAPAARRDFLQSEERRAIAEQASTLASPAPGAPSLSRLLRRGVGHGDAPLQESVGFLDEVFALLSVRLPLSSLVERLTSLFLRQSGAQRAMFWLLDEDGEWRLRDRQSAIADASALPVQSLDAPCRAVLEAVAAQGESVRVVDALADPVFGDALEVRQWGLRGLLAIPLKVADGAGERVIGCLYGDCRAPWHGLADTRWMALELMARHAGALVEVGLLQEDAARKTQRLEMLHHLSRALAGTLDVDQLLSLALRQILQITQGEQGYVFWGEELSCRASLDASGAALAEVSASRSVLARVQRERRPLAVLDVGQDEELQRKASLMIRNTRSVMCVPLLADDALVGLIYISSPTANKTFARQDLDLMGAISSQVALALQNAQAYATIKELNQGLEAKVQARTAELEAAYQELSATQAQLVESEKLASIGTLAGGVAHELNNPLGAILSNAQLLKLDVTDPEQVDSLDMIEEGARRCKEIIAALLRYAREARNPLEPLDLAPLVADALASYAPRLEQAKVQVSLEAAAVPKIEGEAVELRKVLLHLLQNACEAIDEAAGAAGRVAISLAREEAEVVLRVRDDGAGMEPEVQKRMFDPFFTTKPIGSTGLGLSVVQRVIEKHRAQIRVESAPGAGTTVTLAFPALL